MSIGGCALFLPDDVPPHRSPACVMQPGADRARRRHALRRPTCACSTSPRINPDARGVRLGCEFVRLGDDAERTLQRFIDQTQKRKRALNLD